MSWNTNYERWINEKHLDTELREWLEAHQDDHQALEDCFYKNLEFGTGGMRGEIGAGTNRMNVYTVRKASAGLAAYIAAHGEDAKKEASPLPMIHAINLLNLRWKRPKHLLHMAFKHTYLTNCVRHQNSLLQFEN